MNPLNFLSTVQLPNFESLSLAITATRALERFSDLAAGQSSLAPMKPAERIDVMDECLDLVVPNADLSCGFEFTGFSLAEYRAAFAASGQSAKVCENLDAVLRGSAVDALRQAARQRIKVRASYTYFNQCRFWLPDRYVDSPLHSQPEALRTLFSQAYPNWTPLRRSRLAVELLETAGHPGRRLPLRGKRFPRGIGWNLSWIVWYDQRLQPSPDLGHVEINELQLTLPSLESSYFTNHFRARNVFAHIRVSRFTDRAGRAVMLLDEVQSDWMRDLRLQRLQRPLCKRWTHVGQRRSQQPERVPECPVERDWLAIALEAFVEFACQQGAELVAWTPGKIQHELNPGLPLVAAERLYDQRVAKYLRTSVGNAAQPGVESVEYPTYKRNVLVSRRRGGYQLVKPDGKTDVSELLPDKETALSLYRTQAIPTVEHLPAFWLVPDVNDYDEFDDLEVPDSGFTERYTEVREC